MNIKSIRFDQASFVDHILSALMSAFAISMSFRMMAMSATFLGFPAVTMA